MSWVGDVLAWIGDRLAWPGWSGVQGIAAVVGSGSLIAAVIAYRRQVRDADFPGVGFEFFDTRVERPAEPKPEAPDVDVPTAGGAGEGDDSNGVFDVQMTALRGAVFFDVLVMTWAPDQLVPFDDNGRVDLRPRWQYEDGPLTMRLTTFADDAKEKRRAVKVGVTGYIRTPLGTRFVGYRIGLNPEDDREEWRRWRWWEWPWWPRNQTGRWRAVRLPSDRQLRRSPYTDPGRPDA